MRCPFCQSRDTLVVDSRAPQGGAVIRRRRRCENCGKRFTTFERACLEMPQIVKKDGAREDYRREKLKASMTLALRKRPVSPENIDESLDTIERAVVMTGEREIASECLGNLVVAALKALDTIAYIRFASVYFNINDPHAFAAMIQEITASEPANFNEEDAATIIAQHIKLRKEHAELALKAEKDK